MAVSPLDGTLYISDPESHQILKVRDVNDFSEPDRNWEPFIGSGERCLPGDEAHCGDGGLARDAKLAYPKGETENKCADPRDSSNWMLKVRAYLFRCGGLFRKCNLLRRRHQYQNG